MNEQGIAWMIAGGTRAESAEDQRHFLHRLALADSRPTVGGQLLHLRQRLATMVGARPDGPAAGRTLSADCCAA